MMDLFLQLLSVLGVVFSAGFSLAALYHLIMGSLQKNKKQLKLGLMCLAGFVVCGFIGLLIFAKIIRGMY